MPWRFNPFTGNLDETDIPAFNGEIALGSAASPSIFFTGDTNTGIYSPGADQVALSVNGSEGVRLTTTGLGIGTSSPGGLLSLGFADASSASLEFRTSSYENLAQIVANNPSSDTGEITFRTRTGGSAFDRVKIDGSGRLLVGTSSTSQTASVVVAGRDPGTGIYVNTSAGLGGGASSPSYGLYVEGLAWNNATHQYGVYAKQTQQLSAPVTVGYFEGIGLYSTLYGVHSKIDKNLAGFTNGYCYYANLSYSNSGGEAAFGYWYNDTDALLRFKFKANGGIDNYSSNNTNLCDIREKKNIEDLNSTWDCLKHWELKKFHYNEDADTDDKRYGVIAQQVAEFCPEVIADWTKQQSEPAVIDENGNEIEPAKEAIIRMGVKEQQMYWMAIKALQEAQVRIETLEAKVAALESA